MTDTSPATVLKFPTFWLWVFTIGGLALGCGVGFALPAVGQWLLDTVESAPGPVRVAMKLPPALLVPIAAVLGTVGGALLFEVARKESPTLSVADDHIELSRNDRARYIERGTIGAVFREGPDLVLTDHRDLRLARCKASDLRADEIARAFRERGYPWRDRDDPLAEHYVTWVDGRPETGAKVDALLRSRRRALDDDKPGTVEEVEEQLTALGVDVRDRKGRQEIRLTTVS
ncbi:YqeB family protein [Nocardia mexicana]|uniref:Uncharacterized protein n=1 Tax=Nocardia mexicana TaxID=279262 RepID=A0A370GLH1_9NOCA|nr:hypothetical protein [Nocardia mexicana]RDI44497.1 hypothetical protein DFR68_117114 [Nocardia mexicana]